MSNIGSSKIAEMYIGNTKIAQAYLGSSLVYQISQPQPAADYDSYVIHLTWLDRGSFNMGGLKINGVQATTSQVTSIKYYDSGWNEISSNDKDSAIDWNNDNGKAFYGTAIDINFTTDNSPSTVQVKTGTWWGGDVDEVTMHVAGIKDGVETDLGYTSEDADRNIIYTVNI